MGSSSGRSAPDESQSPDTSPLQRLMSRQEVTFARALHRAAPGLSTAWWAILFARGLVPALLAISTGWLVGAVDRGDSLTAPLVFVGFVFVGLQILAPVHQAVGSALGVRTADHLNRRLMDTVSAPEGIAHLERPDLVNDFTMARDFDLGITGPPLSISMDFVAGGLVQMVAGIATSCVLFAFAWWAPLVLIIGWGSTHWLLRESAVWKTRNTDRVRTAQRHADYAYRLAVDAPAAKEVRLFGLADWVIERFRTRRLELDDLRWEATRLRERPVVWSLVVVLSANALVFWQVAEAALSGSADLGAAVVYLQAAIGASAIAFGGLSWAIDSAAAPVAAVEKVERAVGEVEPIQQGQASAAPGAVSIRFEDVTFTYPTATEPVLRGLDLEIPAGTSLAIVGQNGAGKTTLAKLICRLYEPDSGTIRVDGQDMRTLDLATWRSRVAAIFQDFVRYELPLIDNVDPAGIAASALTQNGSGPHPARTEAVVRALDSAGAAGLADLDTTLARGYANGTELSGGQWQRVALARAVHGVFAGAGVVLLDEPTAQLDVRGETEIFERILEATRGCTTILVSHRFNTVRKADRICVIEDGRVIELGTHEELLALGGRYATMYRLQAARFAAGEAELDDQGREVVGESL
ncbi:MAG: ABC transporter ATP-binding protein [Acidimicrobiales bacterium]|nr:ABC transporter ATP-binding protein [Acidimicrobiales bacterium]